MDFRDDVEYNPGDKLLLPKTSQKQLFEQQLVYYIYQIFQVLLYIYQQLSFQHHFYKILLNDIEYPHPVPVHLPELGLLIQNILGEEIYNQLL